MHVSVMFDIGVRCCPEVGIQSFQSAGRGSAEIVGHDQLRSMPPAPSLLFSTLGPGGPELPCDLCIWMKLALLAAARSSAV